MTTLLFYKELVALDSGLHKGLRLAPMDQFRFAADATALPIVVGEFADLARQNAIAFLRVDGGQPLPVALVGLPGGKNLYLDKKGQWTAPYVPAFVRRYPFVFAQTGPDQLTLCVDRGCKQLGTKTGELLFDEQGQPTARVQQALALLGEFQRQHTLTHGFVQRLHDAGLLMQAQADAKLGDGRQMSLQGLLVVDETKLRNLPPATLKAWAETGELGLVYAHLLSLGHLVDLLRRQPAAVPAAPAVAPAVAQAAPQS